MAVQFEQLDLSGYAKINDTTPSASTTYSSQKIEEILPEAGAVIDDSEASTTKTYSSTHIDETYLKKDGNGSGVSVEYTASDKGSAPASGSMLGNLIGWIVGKCNGIGNISNLLTVAKSNLVAAINELRGEIGDLTKLDTTEKTDLVAAINKLNSNKASMEVSKSSNRDRATFSFTQIGNNLRMVSGTKIINVTGGTSDLLFSKQSLGELLGVEYADYTNTSVFAGNGDGTSQSVHIDDVTYVPSEGWVVTFSGKSKAGKMRVNYFAIHWGT